MKAYRIAILYRYLLENTCKGHTVNADNIVEHYETRETPMRSKRSIVIYTTLKR